MTNNANRCILELICHFGAAGAGKIRPRVESTLELFCQITVRPRDKNYLTGCYSVRSICVGAYHTFCFISLTIFWHAKIKEGDY